MGETFVDRYPELRGRRLYCLTCGYGHDAELLDRGQNCPSCAAWWRQPPSPRRRGLWRQLSALLAHLGRRRGR